MVTLDIVPLRSKMPHTGRVTLRYQLPTIKIDVPGDFNGDDRAANTSMTPRIATTPQVEESPEGEALETTAGKGGEAR
jgi:hypothetical protein